MTNLAQKLIIGAVAAGVLVLFVIGFVMGAAVYGWRAAQRAGNEAAAQVDLKTIAAVEIQYYNTHSRTFGTLGQLIKEEMLSSKFSGNPAAADGYVFILRLTPKISVQAGSYVLNADPQSNTTGGKHFYIDSTSPTIRVNPDQPAGGTDPPVKE